MKNLSNLHDGGRNSDEKGHRGQQVVAQVVRQHRNEDVLPMHRVDQGVRGLKKLWDRFSQWVGCHANPSKKFFRVECHFQILVAHFQSTQLKRRIFGSVEIRTRGCWVRSANATSVIPHFRVHLKLLRIEIMLDKEADRDPDRKQWKGMSPERRPSAGTTSWTWRWSFAPSTWPRRWPAWSWRRKRCSTPSGCETIFERKER